ncbi:MAG: TIM44-like domain-containing protein, partial [Deltaproteobacteria bacterium]
FKTLDILKAGDTIFAWDGQALSPQRIVSLQKINKRVRVFNLQTDQPNTFFAASLAVHNKGGGGCFPAGTIIRRPAGQIPIENISANDTVQGVDQQGHIINASVEKLFATRSHVLSVKTNLGELRTTTEHPVGLTDGTFLEAGRLRPGDSVIFRDNGRLIPATVLQTTKSDTKELVYNLSVNQPHTFLADDFVVHNKGGGGFSRSSSGSRSSGSGSKSSSDDIIEWFIIFGIFGTIVILMLKNKKPGKDENLDYVYSRAEITKKSIKTEKLLDFISKQDLALSPKELRVLSEATFRRLQECWQKRDYAPMKTLMMDNLFVQHTAQLQGLIRNNEINKIDELQIKNVDLVNVRYTEKPDQREFTALITASARDYYIDDCTDKFLRGDSRSSQFQEFWIFQRLGNQWLLREIEQSGESDILKDDNFVEMLTDQTIKGIYEDAAAKEGSAGPWLEEPTGQKATRIDRILNFLVQTDKLWNRGLMLERARQVFLDVYLARESSDPASVPAVDLFPQVAESLRKQMEQWQMEGTVTEYRNLCVRKAELILIRNYADPAKDEFTCRISAHAQKIVRKGKRVLTEQQYVTPFEEYWTFGRLDKLWILKEVLPPSRGKKLIAEENVDEESSAQQMEWYSRQTRAN